MSEQAAIDLSCQCRSSRLASLYFRCLLWYALAVAALWILGLEGIYLHPTPFYIIPERASSLSLSWPHWVRHVPPVALFAGSLTVLLLVLRRVHWFQEEPSARSARWMLVGLAVFLFLFSGAIAMLRDGIGGITAAYERHNYEYIGDIGRGLTIRGLFRDYLKMHRFLSMHAKVHPPGPIVLLWLVSYVAGREPLGLSVATMLVSAISVIPLYYWTRDLTDTRTALISCLLYVLTPCVVLFTATSADALFMPLTITTLLLFWRALHRQSAVYALGAGALYAAMSLTSFSLVSIGAFFAFVGLWRLRDKTLRWSVVRTAVVMAAAFLAVHAAVRLWSGFDVIECFKVCKHQFDTDQMNLDKETPRFAWWAWKVLNPACWFFFAGIPVSVLFVWRLARPAPDTKAQFVVFALTLIVLSLLYLARGEGERSAMYIMPFVVLPAAHLLDTLGRTARSHGPLITTLVFLACQVWVIECFFYTYW